MAENYEELEVERDELKKENGELKEKIQFYEACLSSIEFAIGDLRREV
jgi:cell division septum initiation protein DivIVA